MREWLRRPSARYRAAPALGPAQLRRRHLRRRDDDDRGECSGSSPATSGSPRRAGSSAGAPWPYDEERARASVARAFALADAHPDRIPRLYLYQWRAGANDTWDSGLLRLDGTPRPSFLELAARLRPEVSVPHVEPEPPLVWDDDTPLLETAIGDDGAAPPAAAGPTALRVLRRPWLDRGASVRARVTCAAGRPKPCAVALVVRQRPTRVGDHLPAAVTFDRRWLASGAQRLLVARIPARVRRKPGRLYVELRVPGREPLRSVLRAPRTPKRTGGQTPPRSAPVPR